MKIGEILIEGEIGPHEDNELELMLTGKKPAAIIGSENLSSFKPYIKDKTLVLANKFKGGGGATVYVVTLPNEIWRGKQIEKQFMKQKQFPIGSPETKLSHVKMGLLLGYSKEDIRHFLDTRFRFN
jgi:hypothetical protein